jgi:hypothetical protein
VKAISVKKLIYVLAAVKFVLPFVLQNTLYEPHRDEFLYLAEARHLAWGYLELPPLLSVLSFVTNAFGASLFWIKFWPSLGGALTYTFCTCTLCCSPTSWRCWPGPRCCMQRSKDGARWDSLEKIAGTGNSNAPSFYTTYDPAPYPGVSYLRLQ